MKTFETLQNYIDYVPNCIVCGKQMQLSVSARLLSSDGKHNRWGSGAESVVLKFDFKDGILVTNHKTHKLQINSSTNNILEGQELVNRFQDNFSHFKKNCPTCDFKIQAVSGPTLNKKEKHLPHLILEVETLHFTMRGGKDISITKYHSGNPSFDTAQASIKLNHKFLPPISFDFNKFNNFEQLVNRINTIVLFH